MPGGIGTYAQHDRSFKRKCVRLEIASKIHKDNAIAWSAFKDWVTLSVSRSR